MSAAAVPAQPAQAQPQPGGGGSSSTVTSSSTTGGASAGAGQLSASGSGTPSRSSASAGAAPWKGDDQDVDETVKTRRNALRVIVQKMRNFWPADTEARLSRASMMPRTGPLALA